MSTVSRLLSHPRGLISKIAAIAAECSAAQRRMTALRLSPDRFAARPDAAPDTYAEFLFRTSGPLLREPSARARARRAALR
jgi:hypothetical protein